MEVSEKQSRQLDQILNMGDRYIENVKDINTQFPEENHDYCNRLFLILLNNKPPLLKGFDRSFEATSNVEMFLEFGGFAKKYKDSKIEYEKSKIIEDLELKKLQYDTKNAKRIYRTYWWTFSFALIALGISLYNFIKDLL